MKRSLIAGLAVGAVAVAAGGAIAGYRMMDHGPQYAEVIAVTPITKPVRTPREVCQTEEVRHAGTGIGEGAGGNTYTTTEQHCSTVYETKEERSGYEVRYRLKGVEGRTRMDHDPGARIPLRNGQPAAGDPSAGADGST